MIIFDLDGTLANCEHRKHFVEKSKAIGLRNCDNRCGTANAIPGCNCAWKPNWPAFYAACYLDEPIMPVFEIMYRLDKPYEIWSGRCESVREKTENWLCKYLPRSSLGIMKMRPIGDSTPDDKLKERWLDEAIEQLQTIDFVFESDPKSIAMYRRRGIFVFDCAQSEEDF